jgi:hypothetical protein
MDDQVSKDETSSDVVKVKWVHFDGNEEVFRQTLKDVVENAKKIAKADVGILFLTADRICFQPID